MNFLFLSASKVEMQAQYPNKVTMVEFTVFRYTQEANGG